MSRRKRPPSYLAHKPSGRARCRVDGDDVWLGAHGSAESYAAHARITAAWAAAGGLLSAAEARATASGRPAAAGLTVADLVARWWPHAERHYRHPDGRPTSEVEGWRSSLAPLLALFGPTPAAAFGPLSLKAVRQRMIDSGWARRVVNQRTGRIKRLFKWAVAEELVPAAVYQGLAAVAGLQRGRGVADRPPVPPVPAGDLWRAYRRLASPWRAAVRVQLYGGMRPGEVLRLRPCDLDRTLTVDGVPVWVYRPAAHKTAWRGHAKAVALGPRAQRALLPLLKDECTIGRYNGTSAEYVFAMRGRRLPPLVASYNRAVARACRLAGVPTWHVGQLRHSRATAVQRAHGLDAARAVLGHRDANVTTIYAAHDLETAARVAARTG